MVFSCVSINESLEKSLKKYLCCLLLGISLIASGCILVPIADGVSKIGITKGDREALLPVAVKNFQDLIYWGRFQLAGALIKDEVKSSVLHELTKRYKDYRLVETKTDYLDFNEDGTKATVSLTTKRYKVPFYIVEDYAEDQKWEFAVSGGWKFVSAEKSKPVAEDVK